MPHRFDFLVLGSGVAGLSFALQAARHGTVAVLAKRERAESNTAYAQGGIASVLAPTDTFDAHIEDTLVAGAGLCHRDAVEVTVKEGPERVRELVELGADFNRRASGEFDLTREGGHSARRIIHSGDITGREVQRAMLAACDEQPNITFFPHTAAIDLILDRRTPHPGAHRCLGVYALLENGDIERFLAKVTVLATGGAGKVYLYTSNPDVATGDGVAMAYRAGARVANMEFYQFHPTCLYHPEAKSFLISEALRGEGGKLRLKGGATFMERYHSMGALAPRDVVARAIDAELKRTGDECVYLDMTHLGRAFLTERFPNIYATCKAFNIDMAVQPIPVVPAAHYMCGGVVTDLDGRTTLPGLYAIGEVSCTGLHGANRLASNSLLEGLVFGHRAVRRAVEELHAWSAPKEDPPAWDPGSAVESDESVVVTHNWDEIRRLMWNYVGIVRTDKRLMRARRRLELLREEIRDYYWHFKVTRDVIELRNIAEVAYLIVDCASRRRESRGLHFTLDYPHTDDHHWLRDTVLSREL
ncbi:L-aspartate oxidase [Myxococcus sp. RHSTA-1-4]|uniref:L-aspartate oxidase n=1 Tax=Myxococcus sp. RHSTA-1-4 TaxID=2874601 RepID=UPI001CBB67D3|nr:L-aspartate oxidase [Myxococcus sp. RHSTA-1-4]MBZ4417764.1 L-aspartate oxidase [Myxococcus sp. RHSTA-1-4]